MTNFPMEQDATPTAELVKMGLTAVKQLEKIKATNDTWVTFEFIDRKLSISISYFNAEKNCSNNLFSFFEVGRNKKILDASIAAIKKQNMAEFSAIGRG